MGDKHQNSNDFSDPYLRKKLLKPARDIRSLLRWGYPKFATINFVATHSQLSVEERYILTRVIMPPDRIVSRINKKSKKIYFLLIILGFAVCGFLGYMAVVKGEWNGFLLWISLLPFTLITEWKQKTRFWNGNTRLHIKTRHKKWYEWTWASYKSMITDEASAAEIKSSIERHL